MKDLAVAQRPGPSLPPATGSGPSRLGFEAFFEQHHVPLYRALWLVTRNRHEAEEIMQDAFLKLWERWDRVSTLDDPEGYLFRTAINLWRSPLRRAAVAVRKAIHQIPPDDQMATVEQRDAMARALKPLPSRQRAAVVLMDVLDLSSGAEELQDGSGSDPAGSCGIGTARRSSIQVSMRSHHSNSQSTS
jgi:RNA polymerase sigma factor (sigma-70 family)